MNTKICPNSFVLTLFIFLVTGWLSFEADGHEQTGKKHHHPIPIEHPPKPKHHLPSKPSAEVPRGGTKAILTLNSFKKGGDGGGPAECDGKFHSDNTLIAALSTRWFDNKKRCFHHITINGNGRSVRAMVVDECDSRRGCKDNIVDGSPAVWKALGVPRNSKNWGELPVSWSDA